MTEAPPAARTAPPRAGRFSCHLIGDGSLLTQCGDLLLADGHTVYGVFTSDRRVVEWADRQGLPTHPYAAEAAAILAARPFDYLFSIANERILPPPIIRLPRRGCINYHDAPLPRYAGLNATSWALINQETTHGVTWHLVDEGIDTGDILEQRTFPLAPDETARSLNLKCYDQAIRAFRDLVGRLASGTVRRTPQDLGRRTYFGKWRRPPHGGLIRWSAPAAEIDHLVRALDFGEYPNRLGLPKLHAGGRFWLVRRVEARPTPARRPPGVVTAIDAAGIAVAAADRVVVLREVADADGRPVGIAELAETLGLCEGQPIGAPADDLGRRLEALASSLARHEAFWVERLRDLAPPARIGPRPAIVEAAPAEWASVDLPLPTRRASAETEPERSGLVLAAFAVVVSRLAGVERFDLGLADGALDRELGPARPGFAPSVPLRIEAAEDRACSDFLADVREMLHATRRRKTYARDLVPRTPELRRGSAAGPAVLPIAVRLDGDPAWCPERGDAELALALPDRDAGPARLEYRTDAYEPATIERLARQLRTVLDGLLADPGRPVGELPLLTPAERHRLLVEWNATARDYPRDRCIPSLFEAQAARTPEAVAVVFEGRQLTYRELNRRANQLAHHLRRLGVGPEIPIGICLERSVELVVAMLGVLKAGGAYVPLDPADPRERLAFMLEDTRAPVVLTRKRLIAGLPAPGARVVCLDTERTRIAEEREANPASGATAENLAYVIYTSGSTGRPKGVAVPHRAIARLVLNTDYIRLEPSDRVAQASNATFDAATFEIWGALLHGATLVGVAKDVALSPMALAARLRRDGISVLFLTTALFNQVARAAPRAFAPLRYLLFGGEAADPRWVREVLEQGPPGRVLHVYGPTESTTFASWHPVEEVPVGAATVPIGRPIANTTIYLLDRHRRPVPVGVPGELYIGGDGLARGYLSRPELTAQTFIPDPFAAEPGARLYRTGDLARYRPDGSLEFLGRVDGQVKLRGFRVEPGEVEATLSRHPAVREAVVLAREDEPGDKRLVAYVVSGRVPPPSVDDLRGFLAAWLPEYMVPAAFVPLEAVPLTPNGKVDRGALPAPNRSRPDLERAFMAPRTPVEERLAQIWRDVLGLDRVGIHDDFFELGGDSLRAVRLLTRIEVAFGTSLPLAALLRDGTIAQLATMIAPSARPPAWSSLVALQPRGTRPPFFCVHPITGGLFCYVNLARHLDPDQPLYGLQARGLDGVQEPFERIEPMAAAYIEELRTVQPEGPYFLGGYSSGGTVAFEMARQLHAQGQRVALLVSFDHPPFRSRYRRTAWTRHLLPGIVRGLQVRASQAAEILLRMPPDQRSAHVRYELRLVRNALKLAVRRRRAGAALDHAAEVVTGLAGFVFEDADRLPQPRRRVMEAQYRALLAYEPRPYPGRLTVLRARRQPLLCSHDPELGWGGLAAGGVVVREVPGAHMGMMMEPHVRGVAAQLEACLREARAEPRLPLSPGEGGG